MKKPTIIIYILGICLMLIFSPAAFSNYADADELPGWIKNIKFKGDVRFRYQDEDTDPSEENKRYRVRLRAGVETKVNDQWKVGFGLASGSDDPRSTNQTLEDTFETGNANLDYAYAQYQPVENVKILLGKFKNPLWKPKDLLWDGDIRPDGIAAYLNYKPSDNIELFGVPAFFLLDEYKDTNTEDLPNIILLQGGVKIDLKNPGYVKIAASYYEFNDVKGNDWSEHSSGTNSLDANGNWMYDHDAYALEAEAGVTGFPIFLAVFGQYVSADVDKEDSGYLVGVKVGDKKVKQLGQWQAKYNFRRIEMDAWPDFLPDSDFFGGGTGVKGSEIEVIIGLHKNVTFGIDYYRSEEIKGTRDQNLLQLDLVVKF